jgi:PD-(D/E)XK nuclease superfamily
LTEKETPPLGTTAALEVDYTALSDLCWCQRLYFNRYELGIVPADQPPATALDFGTAIHEAIYTLAETGSIDSALSKFDELYSNPYEANGWAEVDTLRNPYVGRALIYAYHQKFGIPQDLYREIGAAVEVDETVYYGRIDRIADNPYKTVTDIKTTSGMIWLPQARLNWQLIGYAHMARELTGVDSEEVAIDGLVVPRLGKKMIDKGLPHESEYALTIHDNLHLRTAMIHQRDYDEWHRWLRWCVFQIHMARDTGSWPMRAPVACNRYNKDCAYGILCRAENEEQELRLREALYIEQRWHPFEGE